MDHGGNNVPTDPFPAYISWVQILFLLISVVAASEAAKEAVWLKKFLLDLHVIPSADRPVTLYCDNSGAIAQSKNQGLTKSRNTY